MVRARDAFRPLAVVAALLLAGCGDSDRLAPQRTPSDPGSSHMPSDPAASAPAPTTPTQPPTSEPPTPPGVEPASGRPFNLPSLTGAFPEGWQVVGETKGSASAGDRNPLTGGFFYFSDLLHLGSRNFDKIVATVLVSYEDEKNPPVRTENRVVDGVEGWVLQGRRDGDEFHYEWGTVYRGQDIWLTFDYLHAPSDPMAVVDSVLASVEWKQ